MKKIILTGDDRSGKTFLALNIAKAFDKVVFLQARNIKKRQSFMYDEVTKETELIIIDDVNSENFEIFEDLIYSEKLTIDRIGKPQITTNTPNVIITFSGSHEFFRNYGVSFTIRCKFIKTWIDNSFKHGRPMFMTDEVKFFQEFLIQKNKNQ